MSEWLQATEVSNGSVLVLYGAMAMFFALALRNDARYRLRWAAAERQLQNLEEQRQSAPPSPKYVPRPYP